MLAPERPTPVPQVVPGRASERQLVADQVATLAADVSRSDPAVSSLLERLADAVRHGRTDETRGYVGALDPRGIAEMLLARKSWLWGVLEVARAILLFAPIGLTWFSLSAATDAYGKVVRERPDLLNRPFLLLWEEGLPGALDFSTMALADATLIAMLVALSLVLHIGSDIRDPRIRERVLLKESHIRSLLGQATSLAAPIGLGDSEAEILVDEMVAEERRIYERAMEREQQLFEMEDAIKEFRQATADLARLADALTPKPRVRAASTKKD